MAGEGNTIEMVLNALDAGATPMPAAAQRGPRLDTNRRFWTPFTYKATLLALQDTKKWEIKILARDLGVTRAGPFWQAVFWDATACKQEETGYSLAKHNEKKKKEKIMGNL